MSARGSAVVEALVAGAVVGVAVAAVAAAGAMARAGVVGARDVSTALALAGERLEALRVGPRTAGADAPVAGGVTFARAWEVEGGRGEPVVLRVRLAWPGRTVALVTEVWP